MARVIRKEQCPICKDSGQDNLAIYDDGSSFCFACNKANVNKEVANWIKGHAQDINARGLTAETLKFFDYQVGKDRTGQAVHIANYFDDRDRLIAQKIRTKDKKFKIIGDGKDLPLYGKWKWSPNPNISITITEGEIDCLSVAASQGCQYPVVSIPTGASQAKKVLERNLPWLMGFKFVTLAFDNDKDGKKATQECIDLFEPGKVKVVDWGNAKDANELLKDGKVDELRQALRYAKTIMPERIVSSGDIMDRILQRPTKGIEYPWPTLTDITYGFQPSEIHVIVAANGIGKTEYVKDLMYHFLDRGMNIGLFSFEQSPESTIRRIVGAKLGQKLHLPDAHWDEARIREEAMKLNDRLFLYDKAGSGDDEEIMRSIRYLAKAKDVKLIIIDNLKGLGGNGDTERMTNNMKKFQALKIELGITIILLSHVAKDKIGRQAYVTTSPKKKEEYLSQTAEELANLINKPGLEWESGRIPTKENVEGASAVCDLADYVFALARNTTAENPDEQRTLIVKTIKARLDGSKNGKVFKLYHSNSGRLEEQGTASDIFGADAF